jgi:hypothetical protein
MHKASIVTKLPQAIADRRDPLAEVVCFALAVAVLTLACRIASVW